MKITQAKLKEEERVDGEKLTFQDLQREKNWSNMCIIGIQRGKSTREKMGRRNN